MNVAALRFGAVGRRTAGTVPDCQFFASGGYWCVYLRSVLSSRGSIAESSREVPPIRMGNLSQIVPHFGVAAGGERTRGGITVVMPPLVGSRSYGDRWWRWGESNPRPETSAADILQAKSRFWFRRRGGPRPPPLSPSGLVLAFAQPAVGEGAPRHCDACSDPIGVRTGQTWSLVRRPERIRCCQLWRCPF